MAASDLEALKASMAASDLERRLADLEALVEQLLDRIDELTSRLTAAEQQSQQQWTT